MRKQLKEELACNTAKAKADVEKAEKGLADANNVMTSTQSEVSTVKEQVQCVLAHLCWHRKGLSQSASLIVPAFE